MRRYSKWIIRVCPVIWRMLASFGIRIRMVCGQRSCVFCLQIQRRVSIGIMSGSHDCWMDWEILIRFDGIEKKFTNIFDLLMKINLSAFWFGKLSKIYYLWRSFWRRTNGTAWNWRMCEWIKSINWIVFGVYDGKIGFAAISIDWLINSSHKIDWPHTGRPHFTRNMSTDTKCVRQHEYQRHLRLEGEPFPHQLRRNIWSCIPFNNWTEMTFCLVSPHNRIDTHRIEVESNQSSSTTTSYKHVVRRNIRQIRWSSRKTGDTQRYIYFNVKSRSIE